MSELLEEAIQRLRQLPEQMQENVASAVILQLEEEPERCDLAFDAQLNPDAV